MYINTYIYRHIYIYMHELYACTHVCICRQGDRVRMSRMHTYTHNRPDTPKLIPGGIFLFEDSSLRLTRMSPVPHKPVCMCACLCMRERERGEREGEREEGRERGRKRGSEMEREKERERECVHAWYMCLHKCACLCVDM